jgi:hypothetical protein
MPPHFAAWASIAVPSNADHGAIYHAATGRTLDPQSPSGPVYYDGRLYIPGVTQAALNGAAPGAPPAVRYVPVYLVRQRLEAAGLWEAIATALAAEPAKMLRVLSLEVGVATNDPDALAMLTAVGADPAEILAP